MLWLGQLPEKERLLPWELFIQCIPSARKASRAPRAASPTQHPRGAQGPGSDLAVIMWGKAKPCWVASSINVSQLGAEAFHIPNSDVISNNLAYSRGARGPLVALLALIFFGRSVQEKQKKIKPEYSCAGQQAAPCLVHKQPQQKQRSKGQQTLSYPVPKYSHLVAVKI